jgi:hypothetical protein
MQTTKKTVLCNYFRGDFFDDYLLTLIEEGQVSLLRAPPPLPQKRDEAHSWASSQLSLLPLGTRGLLEECMRDFSKNYMDVKESEWASAIETEISRDLLSMQLQPTIMDTYRRFVVIKGHKEEHIPWDRDGVRSKTPL